MNFLFLSTFCYLLFATTCSYTSEIQPLWTFPIARKLLGIKKPQKGTQNIDTNISDWELCVDEQEQNQKSRTPSPMENMLSAPLSLETLQLHNSKIAQNKSNRSKTPSPIHADQNKTDLENTFINAAAQLLQSSSSHRSSGSLSSDASGSSTNTSEEEDLANSTHQKNIANYLQSRQFSSNSTTSSSTSSPVSSPRTPPVMVIYRSVTEAVMACFIKPSSLHPKLQSKED